ncbi:MAG: hypothetical protein Q8R43_00785 [Alphaproteobacteria bacterium]|nr:hypothetical protein [Alphaproteobacteria bacterium]
MKFYLKIMIILGAVCSDSYGSSELTNGDRGILSETEQNVPSQVIGVSKSASAKAKGTEKSNALGDTPLTSYPAFNARRPENTGGSENRYGEAAFALSGGRPTSSEFLISEGTSTVGSPSEARSDAFPEE